MNTKEGLSDFAVFCYDNFNIKIPPAIIEAYLKTMMSINQGESDILYSDDSHYKVKECKSGNVECSHISFDSARCDNCEYLTEPFS
jgi:hypothetical protein